MSLFRNPKPLKTKQKTAEWTKLTSYIGKNYSLFSTLTTISSRITSWVDTVNKHIEADDFDKCVIMENIDYSDDIERPSSSKSPGNHHHVEIVLYNGD